MASGDLGLNGQHAIKVVVSDTNIEEDTVIIHHPHMEEKIVLDHPLIFEENATLYLVQVSAQHRKNKSLTFSM